MMQQPVVTGTFYNHLQESLHALSLRESLSHQMEESHWFNAGLSLDEHIKSESTCSG